MKKILPLSLGILGGLIFVLYINILAQGLASNFLLDQKVSFYIKGIRLVAEFTTDGLQFWNSFFVIITPLLASIILIEIAIAVIYKNENKGVNIFSIVFVLVNSGFLLVYIIVGIISVLFKDSFQNAFVTLLNQSYYTHNQQLILILVPAVLLFGYINFILKRMRKNLPVVIENKNRGNSNVKK